MLHAGQLAQVDNILGGHLLIHRGEDCLDAVLPCLTGGVCRVVQVGGQVTGHGVIGVSVEGDLRPAAAAYSNARRDLAVFQSVQHRAVRVLTGNVAEIGLHLGGNFLVDLSKVHQRFHIGESFLRRRLVLGLFHPVVAEVSHVHVNRLGNARNASLHGVLPHLVIAGIAGGMHRRVGVTGELRHPDFIMFLNAGGLPQGLVL